MYEWVIDLIESKTKGNPEKSLAYSTHIKRLSNTMKNYKGKIQGLRNTQLLKTKELEEQEIERFILNDEILEKKFKNLFTDINKVYTKKMEIAESNLWFALLFRLSDNFKLAKFIYL